MTSHPPTDRFVRDIRPEYELLLCCARGTLDAVHSERIAELLTEELDWPWLIRAAREHGLMPLLYRHLSSGYPDALPPSTLETLTDQFRQNAAKNLLRTTELLKVIKNLKEHGINALPFKGPVLAVQVYGNVSLRQFADLDILVRKEDAPAAMEVLIAGGYRLRNMGVSAEPWADPVQNHVALHNGGTTVELHWSLTEIAFHFPLEQQIRERTGTVSLAGVRVDCFLPEDLLLYLSIHAAKHFFGRIEWLAGIAEVIRKHPDLQWSRVLDEAAAVGARRLLLLNLLLTRDLLSADLPKEVNRLIDVDSRVSLLAAEARHWPFCERRRPTTDLRAHLVRTQMRERLRDRLHSFAPLWRVSIGDREWISVPPSLSFLYYFIRPIRLIRKYLLP